ALARAVPSHDAEELARRNRERDVLERLEALVARPPEGMERPLLQRVDLLARDAEGLRHPVDDDRRHAARGSAHPAKCSGGRDGVSARPAAARASAARACAPAAGTPESADGGA